MAGFGVDAFAQDLRAGGGGSDAGGFEEDLERLQVTPRIESAFEHRLHLFGREEKVAGGLGSSHIHPFDEENVSRIFQVWNVGNQAVGAVRGISCNASEEGSLVGKRVGVDDRP